MPTIREVAQAYAEQIRDTARIVQKSMAKTASVNKAACEVLDAIFCDVDEYRAEDRPGILQTLDDELGVPRGRMEHIKKGSVQNLLDYEQMVMLLLNEIEYD